MGSHAGLKLPMGLNLSFGLWQSSNLMHCTDRAVSAADGVGGLEQSWSCISIAIQLLSDSSIIIIHIDTSTAIAVRTYLNNNASK